MPKYSIWQIIFYTYLPFLNEGINRQINLKKKVKICLQSLLSSTFSCAGSATGIFFGHLKCLSTVGSAIRLLPSRGDCSYMVVFIDFNNLFPPHDIQ